MKNENLKKYFILEILEYYQDWTKKIEEWVLKSNDKNGN